MSPGIGDHDDNGDVITADKGGDTDHNDSDDVHFANKPVAQITMTAMTFILQTSQWHRSR